MAVTASGRLEVEPGFVVEHSRHLYLRAMLLLYSMISHSAKALE